MDRPNGSKVLVVGWDSADRDMVNPLLDAGRLPNLNRLIQHGVIGTMLSPGPVTPQVVYNTVATGKHADKHGVLGTHEIGPDRTVRAVTSLSRRERAFWQILSDNDRTCHVVNFPATGPAERVNGTFVSPAFFSPVPASHRDPFDIPADSVLPTERLDALKQFIVSLKDLDAQTIAMFVPRLRELGEEFRRLEPIALALARTFAIHAVATWLMENTQWDLLSVNYPVIELLWRRFGHCRPPRLPWVDQQEHDLFGQVATGAIVLCDMLLGRLLELAGEDAAVVLYSPLGYAPPRGPIGPGAAATRTSTGIFVMRAPGVHEDQLLHRVTDVDLCPTVLHLCGLACTEGFDGQVLQDAFADYAKPIGAGPSMDASPTCPPAPPALVPWQQAMAFDAPYSDRRARRVQTDNEWTLVRVLLTSRQPQRAMPLLIRLYTTNPLQVDRAVMVAEALYLTGLVPEAMAVIGPIAQTFPQSPTGLFMAGMIALYEEDIYRALDLFEAAVRDGPQIPELLFYLGHACALINQVPRAIWAYRRSVEMDPVSVRGHLGLSEVLYRSGEYSQAADSALNALGVDFANPAGHVALGKALVRLGQEDRARQAFEAALRFAPQNVTAEKYLAWMDRKSGVLPDEPQTTSSDQAPSVQAPRRLGWAAYLACQAAVRQAKMEVSRWHDQFVKDLAAADRRLDEYLAANAAALSAHRPAHGAHQTSDAAETAFQASDWVIRPALPSDQPALRRAFEDIFTNPHEVDVLVIHPAETREPEGIITTRLIGERGETGDLRLSIAGKRDAARDNETEAFLITRLLRAAIARAAAGGAKRLVCTLLESPGQNTLRRRLQRIGFEALLEERAQTMDMAAFRDRCLRIVKRYERQQAIPDDMRLVELSEVPYERVDQFLRTFFQDGAGVPPEILSPTLSRVLLKGDTIIGCMVGYVSAPGTFLATRLCVQADFRHLWAMPWLCGDASRAACEAGLSVAQFWTDEQRYPDFVKIARGTGAKEIGRVYTMALSLAAKW